MKKVLFAIAAAGLMLTACSSTKKAEEAQAPAAPQLTVEQAMQQCQTSAQDKVAFEACMRDKGFQPAAQAQQPAVASEPVAAPDAAAAATEQPVKAKASKAKKSKKSKKSKK
ncbi:hypothetical protein BG910_09755 [Neisseria chenwenguii]|uniref:Uncharacterized protein n=1 Tax=Neisseria chenwenguii TaxID=1853278 RepID=A0A220S399_9NEIS|nr:hypothetical protein [Neisseria chenwenguii]ASK27971.1 hypothetical protein BG910_09755 [Neisseria chenwenguii]